MGVEIWSDLDDSLKTDSQGRLKKVSNVDAVYVSIDNILGTFQGERVMLPEFASRLKSLVFEPINESLMNYIGNEVKRVIEFWDDRVKVTGVNFYSDPDRNTVSIVLAFVIRGYSQTFQFQKTLTTT